MSSIILGSGSHRYQWIDNWAKLPSGKRFGYTHGIVIDSEERIHVFNQSKNAVVTFDRDGKFQNSWGEAFAKGAHGMFLSREGNTEYLYLTDLERHLVAKATLDGKILWEIGAPDLPDVYRKTEQFQPTDVAVAAHGDFYVCDGYGENWIHHYSSEAKHIRSWGGKGTEPGKFDCPHGIWVDTRGERSRLLVADRGNKRIQMFDLEGQHLGFVTDDLRLPCCFYQAGEEVYIPDLLARVTIFNRQNELITHLGDNPGIWEHSAWPNIPQEDLKAGKFVAPHAVCVDSAGSIYVAEWYSRGRVTKLQRL